ncbi:MAG: L,D-transpeptidase family protein [Baekduia sp.]
MLRIAVLATFVLAALAPAASAQGVPADSGTVLPGVTAAGVDLGGLTLAAAEQKLTTEFGPHAARPLVVRVAGRRFELKAADAKVTFDALTTAKRAIRLKEAGAVQLKLTWSADALQAFVAGIAADVDRPGRDATMTIGLKKVTVKRSRAGAAVPQKEIAGKLAERIATPGSSALIVAKTAPVRAAVNANDLRNRLGGTVITVDKKNFRLRLFKRLKVVKSYGVAVGQPAYPTPTGRFQIQNKQINPTWSVPNSPWAGELQGTTVAGGAANNPLKARWMGITNGVGIHGTGQPWTIGSRASHGCIRMRVPDVIKLYRRVPVGTPVVIR